MNYDDLNLLEEKLVPGTLGVVEPRIFDEFIKNSIDKDHPVDRTRLRDVIRSNLVHNKVPANIIYVNSVIKPFHVRVPEIRKLYMEGYFDDGWHKINPPEETIRLHYATSLGGKLETALKTTPPNVGRRFLTFQRVNKPKIPHDGLERVYIAKSVIGESEEEFQKFLSESKLI